jgi:hypothetical protein
MIVSRQCSLIIKILKIKSGGNIMSKQKILIFLIALSFVFAGSFLGAPPCNEDVSGTLFGTVTDSNGDGLSGVTVSVSGNTDITNNSGYYCISGLTVNNSSGSKIKYTVTFSKSGYTNVTENNVRLDDDAGRELSTEMSNQHNK